MSGKKIKLGKTSPQTDAKLAGMRKNLIPFIKFALSHAEVPDDVKGLLQTYLAKLQDPNHYASVKKFNQDRNFISGLKFANVSSGKEQTIDDWMLDNHPSSPKHGKGGGQPPTPTTAPLQPKVLFPSPPLGGIQIPSGPNQPPGQPLPPNQQQAPPPPQQGGGPSGGGRGGGGGGPSVPIPIAAVNAPVGGQVPRGPLTVLMVRSWGSHPSDFPRFFNNEPGGAETLASPAKPRRAMFSRPMRKILWSQSKRGRNRRIKR